MRLTKRLLFLVFLLSASTVFAQVDLTQPATDATRSAFEEFIAAHAPNEDAFVAVQRLAYFPILRSQWSDAVAIFKKYENSFPTMHERFEKIIAILQAPSEHLKITNLGPNINSKRDEFSPVISADGSKLYFTKDNAQEEDDHDDDIVVSQWKDGAWQRPVEVGPTIDTRSQESVNCISADGTLLLFFGNYAASFGAGDLFYAEKQDDGSWGYVHHFQEPINTKYFEGDGTLSSDGKALFFSSDRPGGIGEYHEKEALFHGRMLGNTDIYVSLKQPDGRWGTPIDLGPVINTPFSERKPFLHPDGKTLYFCSDGHAGLGMLDIFKSTRLSDTSWTEWSEPVNLGKEINNGADNFGYRVSTDGTTAYLSLENRSDGYGGDDLYSMTLSEAARPAPVATVTGIVSDENGKPLAASIKWDDLETSHNIGELASDPKTGGYFITLSLNKNFGYYAEKPGYYPVSKNVDLRGATTATARTENIVLVSIKSMRESDVAIRLNNIFFDFDKATLKPESYPELDRLADFLQHNRDVKAEVGGHTDAKGAPEYNAALSKKRSQAVVDYLVSKGCTATMLVATGYGDSKPVASNESDEGRALNRRVEVRFVK